MGVGGGGRVGGVRVDVIKELKFLGKFTQKKIQGGGGQSGGFGLGGEGGCNRRIEVFGKIHQKKIRRGGRSGGFRLGGSGWM